MRAVVSVLADWAAVDQNQKLCIGGIFQEFNPLSLPWVVPQMYAVFQLVADVDEIQGEHRMRFSLYDPTRTETVISDGPLPPLPIERMNPDRPVVFNMPLGIVAMPIESEGRYKFVLTVDGKKVAEVPMYVNPPAAQS
jgi:hypothetical protein